MVSNKNVEYPHLFLRAWPFTKVPDEEFCKIWADRNKLKEEIESTFSHAIKRKISQICIFWAWYGAGKTHSLMHYQWKLNQTGEAYVVFTEFPQNPRSFLDLCKTFSENLDFERLREILIQVFEYLGRETQGKERKRTFYEQIANKWRDFTNAAEKLAYSNGEEAEIAEMWMRLSNLKKKERDAINVSANITKDDEAIKLITCITKSITFNSEKLKLPKILIWMIDEFNRIDDVRREDHRTAMRFGLHKVFNHTSKNFCLVLACSTRSIDDIYTILGDALRDRLSAGAPPMRIQPLRMDEAEQFIKELLENFRPPHTEVPEEYFPFSIEAVKYTLSHMLANNVPLTPRKVMDFHEFVLHEGEDLIKKGEIKVIMPEFASKCFDKIPKEYYKI